MKINGVGFQGRDSGPLKVFSENICIARVAKRLENISFSFVTDEKGSTYTADLGVFLRDLYNSNQELKRQLAELRRQASPLASPEDTLRSCPTCGSVNRNRPGGVRVSWTGPKRWEVCSDAFHSTNRTATGYAQCARELVEHFVIETRSALWEAVVENLKTVKSI